VRGRVGRGAVSLVTYGIAGAAVWAALGATLGAVHAPALARMWGGVYALCFGTIEALALPFRAPSSTWQVPASWVAGRGWVGRQLVWGATLGPGLLTRNPFAGIWLAAVLLVGAPGPVTGALIGALAGGLHGVCRATGVLAGSRTRTDPIGLALHQFRWRRIDGLLLLLIGAWLLRGS
jgi:hypothetical protein